MPAPKLPDRSDGSSLGRRATRALLLAALALAPGASSAVQTGTVCAHVARSFARLADLPPGAVAALGFAMAERGQPFEVGDAIRPGARRPFTRFTAAALRGCALAIRYEYGGIAHGFATALLTRRGAGWALVRAR